MTTVIQKPSYLSNEYWTSLSDAGRALYILIRPLPNAVYEVDVGLSFLETFLKDQEADMLSMGGSFELDPDFQRGHVWTDEQRVRYTESLIRGQAPRTILFNSPGWDRKQAPGDIPAHTFQCIDGLQRLTTVRQFVRGELEIFGGLTIQDLKGTPFDTRRNSIKVAVYEFAWRADLLQFYLDLNVGGTQHSAAELQRVRGLLTAAQNERNLPSKTAP